MKPLKLVALIAVLAPAFATLQAKPKKPYKLPAVFNQAQYVYVEAVDGQQFDPRLNPDDREAIGDVQDALSDWHRYVLTQRRDEADLIFVVRKGRLASANVGVNANSGSQEIHGQVTSRQGSGSSGASRPGCSGQGNGGGPGCAGSGDGGPVAGGPGYGTSVGGEVGPPDDLLEVYQPNPNARRGTLLWQRTLADGLDPDNLALFKELKDEVDRTYPVQPTSQAKKKP